MPFNTIHGGLLYLRTVSVRVIESSSPWHGPFGLVPGEYLLAAVLCSRLFFYSISHTHPPPPNYWKYRKLNCPCYRPPVGVWVKQGGGPGSLKPFPGELMLSWRGRRAAFLSHMVSQSGLFPLGHFTRVHFDPPCILCWK